MTRDGDKTRKGVGYIFESSFAWGKLMTGGSRDLFNNIDSKGTILFPIYFTSPKVFSVLDTFFCTAFKIVEARLSAITPLPNYLCLRMNVPDLP